ncbi:MAG: hypothetical protein ACTSPB_19045 [Candidatus Thorarchaeota archaeon]
MVKLEFFLAIIVGLTVFLTDFVFGWLTFLSGPIPVIFIMAIIIGLVAGTHPGAVFATLITWIGGILIGILIAPIVFADIMNPDQTLLGLFLFVFIYPLRGFYTLSYEGNIVEVLVVGLVYLIMMLIVTPVLYLISFAFAPIGVVIGKFIRRRVGGRLAKPSPPVAQETPVIQSTPVVEEPTGFEEPEVVEESTEDEEEFSDDAEN